MDSWRQIGLMLVLPLFAAGCATVDPRMDYQSGAAHIARSTGQQEILPEDDPAAIEQSVAAMLEEGLTADEAVRMGLLNNARFQAAWKDVGMARADLVQSGLLSNPSIGVSARFPSGGGLANVEASVAQNIAELWQIPAREDVAQRALDQAILNLARQAAELASTTKVAYFAAVGADRSYDIAQQNIAIARQLLETSVARRDAGAGNELDVNLARSSALEAELTLETERLDRAEARRELANHLGLAVDADELLLSDALPATTIVMLDNEQLIQLARESRLDIQAARENVATLAAAVKYEQRRILQVIDVGVGSERESRPPGERSASGEWIVGPTLELKLPIFDQNQAQIAKAQYKHQQAQHLLNALDCQMVQDVRGAVDRAQTAWKVAMLADEQFVPLAQSNLTLSQESYRVGKASMLSVLESQRFLLASQRRSIDARVKAATSTADVERVVGRPLDVLGCDASESKTNSNNAHTKCGDQ